MSLIKKIKDTIRHYEEQIEEENYEVERLINEIARIRGVINGYETIIEDLKTDISGEDELAEACD